MLCKSLLEFTFDMYNLSWYICVWLKKAVFGISNLRGAFIFFKEKSSSGNKLCVWYYVYIFLVNTVQLFKLCQSKILLPVFLHSVCQLQVFVGHVCVWCQYLKTLDGIPGACSIKLCTLRKVRDKTKTLVKSTFAIDFNTTNNF